MSKPKLTVKQEAFITEYIRNKGNATQAAINAGYSKNTSRVIGLENLQKPYIRAEIEKRLKKKDKKKVAQADEVLEILTKFARGRMKEEQIIVEGTGDGVSKASIMKKKIANKDQLTALDKLARIHGLYNDKIEIATNEEEVDMHKTTLAALKTRKVAGFNDNEEEENG